MAREIAVFVGADGACTVLEAPGRVVVYRRAQGAWEPDRETGFSCGGVRGMRELRQKMGELLPFLGSCRVFVARSAAGVPFFELEKAGHSVWECEGRPADFLEQVWTGEEQARAAEATRETAGLPVPEETSAGHYYVNIREVQGGNADLTSKQALQQFVRRGRFLTLTIGCSHVPPWVEAEALCRGFGFETQQLGPHEFRVRVAARPPGA